MIAKALVVEAKQSELLPSLMGNLAGRATNKIGDAVLPWRWFGVGKGKDEQGKDEQGKDEQGK